MKKILFFLILPLVLTSCSRHFEKTSQVIESFPGLAHQEYVSGIEDLPLYFGFDAEENGTVSYDSADGRIIDAAFSSKKVAANDVRKFYDETLPQLGWKKVEYQVYRREGETLKVNILEQNGNTSLKFQIRPAVS